MLGRAGRSTRIIQRAGLGFGEGDEFGNRLRRHARMHGHDVRRAHHQTHRHVIAHRIVGQFVAQKRRQPQRAAVENQRVAVGGCVFGDFRGDHAAVIDDDALAEMRAHALRHEARDEIAAAAGLRSEHADGFVGVVLRAGAENWCGKSERQNNRHRDHRVHREHREWFSCFQHGRES